MEEISKNSKSARCISPIILFVYNRFWHTYKTIEALKKNKLANQSILFIYSDGAKSEKDNLEVQKVRNYIKSIKGFKLVKIVEREKNYGLANNIINGVTEIINKHNKIIVNLLSKIFVELLLVPVESCPILLTIELTGFKHNPLFLNIVAYQNIAQVLILPLLLSTTCPQKFSALYILNSLISFLVNSFISLSGFLS